MSIDLTENSITEAAQRTFDDCPDERTRELFVALVRHLHDFTREVRLTGDEWFTAMDFLVRVGRISTETRQEYVLLSDILGLSALVDLINHENGSSTTDSTVLGPFYVEGRPTAANGSDISGGVPGMPMFFTGKVLDPQGNPVARAHVDTWHSDGDGFYDVQQAEKLDNRLAMRALLTTDDNGRFWYRSITPRYYSVPTDGPCGEIIRAAKRSPMRPEHIHFWFHAEGYEPLITTLFRADDPYLTTDAVFGAKRSLVVDFVQHGPGTAPDGTEVDEPFQTVEWTFVLAPKRDQ
jgi:hydroxyquinol 1,2-dioxygenase